MDFVKSYLIGLVILCLLGTTTMCGMREHVRKSPDTFACQWAPPGATLHLKGWRGKVARRTYRFEDASSRLEYEVKRDGYAQCVRTPGEIAPEDLEKVARNKRKDFGGGMLIMLALFGLFGVPMVEDLENNRHIKKEEEEYRLRRSREAKKEEEARKRRAREYEERQKELVVERERSRVAHEERLARKRKKAQELEARTKANAERRRKK